MRTGSDSKMLERIASNCISFGRFFFLFNFSGMCAWNVLDETPPGMAPNGRDLTNEGPRCGRRILTVQRKHGKMRQKKNYNCGRANAFISTRFFFFFVGGDSELLLAYQYLNATLGPLESIHERREKPVTVVAHNNHCKS